jgi:hypothetical protein
MDVGKYETANSWFSAMHEKGFEVPIILCQAIEKIMKDEKTTFPVAFKRLEGQKQIKVKGKVIGFTAFAKRI